MVKAWCLAGLLVACLAAGSARASARGAKPRGDPNDTAPTFAALKAAIARARAERCRTPSCQAIEAIDGLMQIVTYTEDNEEMGSARLLFSPAVVRRRRGRALLDRRDLYAPFCATSTKILSRVPAKPDPDNDSLLRTLLEAAVDVDLRNHGHCAGDMVAAMPKSPAIDQLRKDAYHACENPFDGHPPPKAACRTLVKGLPTDQ